MQPRAFSCDSRTNWGLGGDEIKPGKDFERKSFELIWSRSHQSSKCERKEKNQNKQIKATFFPTKISKKWGVFVLFCLHNLAVIIRFLNVKHNLYWDNFKVPQLQMNFEKGRAELQYRHSLHSCKKWKFPTIASICGLRRSKEWIEDWIRKPNLNPFKGLKS